MVACALLVLGFTKELVEMLISPESGSFKAVTIAVAVLALYCTDFAINAGKTDSSPRDVLWDDEMLMLVSHVLCEESCRRHAADPEAASWRRVE